MASTTSMTTLVAAASGLPAGEILSGIFGSISMTAWICLLLPQLIANYRAKNAEALSVLFLIVWFLGDVSNFIGALLTSLAPSAIALAGYFCFLDVALIGQTLYYNSINSRPSADDSQVSEASPLIGNASVASASHRGPSTDDEPSTEPHAKTLSGHVDTPAHVSWLRNCFNLLAIYVVGLVAWYVSYKAGLWNGSVPSIPDSPDGDYKRAGEIIGLCLGYISATFYLCARVPQIVKNYKAKSCEGLSLLFFMLSTTGNLTYGLSLAAYSQERQYLLKAFPWLLGSLGTIVEDSIIFVQFRLYANRARHPHSEP
ncbi:hypothetical protein CDD81_4170 [Ophiocordyceps australis]|uniref:Uncharacterized protein n=1 Tax=Ophiocordyceps australis TaxID=1399860 RepID=A0A2C5XDS7_9HYPO|nr:hypothetical protein CDD81_4170 [Ophiocordyceps australis]